MIGVARQIRRFAMERVARQADDAEAARKVFTGELLGPVEGRALRVGVDQRDAIPAPCPFTGEMQGERRFTGAALLVEQGDDHRLPPEPSSRGSVGVPEDVAEAFGPRPFEAPGTGS